MATTQHPLFHPLEVRIREANTSIRGVCRKAAELGLPLSHENVIRAKSRPEITIEMAHKLSRAFSEMGFPVTLEELQAEHAAFHRVKAAAAEAARAQKSRKRSARSAVSPVASPPEAA